MPYSESPLDAPENNITLAAKIPQALLFQLALLPIIIALAYFLQWEPYKISIAGMSLLLLAEMLLAPSVAESSLPHFRFIAFAGAGTVLLGILLSMIYPTDWIIRITPVGMGLLIFYFFAWGTLPQSEEQGTPFGRVLLGSLLSFFYFCTIGIGFTDSLKVFYLVLFLAPSLFLTIVLFSNYWITSKEQKAGALEELNLVRLPQLVYIAFSISNAYSLFY